MFFFIYVDGYAAFWILGFVHIPLLMYTPIEQLRQIKVFGWQLFYTEVQDDRYLQSLRNVCVTGFVVVQVAAPYRTSPDLTSPHLTSPDRT